MRRALVIDDEAQIRKLLRIGLEPRGYEVAEAETGFEGIQALASIRPDIVLLDLGLPDRDGAAVLAEIRDRSEVPVIVISVRDRETDIVALLDGGADDYVTKPFNLGELVARMNAALRRRSGRPEEPYSVDGLVVDFEQRIASVDGERLKLTPTEYAILAVLARAGGRVVTKSSLLRAIWGPLGDLEQGSLRVHLSSMRKKMEGDPALPRFIVTEAGIGYRLKARSQEGPGQERGKKGSQPSTT
ncbi:MAG TPA: response regulator transcription factor [Rectinemataceae bacterium]|nr:response regulator transcription factor [Rectinemataceae bacterium]